MAVVTENYSDWKLNKGLKWTAQRGFLITDVETDQEALDACPVQPGNLHPNNTRLIAQELAVEKGARHWHVIVPYSFDQYTVVDDPLNAPLKITPIDDVEAIAMDVDVRGHAIVNAAHIPYTPKSTRPQHTIGLRVVRNEPFWDMIGLAQYVGRVNSNGFSITGPGGFSVAPNQCLCPSIIAASEYEIGAQYVPIAYTFLFRSPLDDQFPSAIKDDPFQNWQLNVGQTGWYLDESGKVASGNFGYTIASAGADGDPGKEIGREIMLDGLGIPLVPSGGRKVFVIDQKGIAHDPITPNPLTIAPEFYQIDESTFLTKIYRYRQADFSALGL